MWIWKNIKVGTSHNIDIENIDSKIEQQERNKSNLKDNIESVRIQTETCVENIDILTPEVSRLQKESAKLEGNFDSQLSIRNQEGNLHY